MDNHSTDRSLDIIGEFPKIDVVALKENSGYSAAANIGINRSSSRLVVIANPDVFLDPGFTTEIITAFKQDDAIAMLSPLILRFDRKTVDSAGLSSTLALYPKDLGFNQNLDKVNLENREIFSVCGAVTVFSREALEKLSVAGEYYDEDFFLFWEDFDIGWRAQLYGLKIMLYSSAIAYHYRGGAFKKNFLSRFSLSLSKNSTVKYHLIKNRFLILIKNFRIKNNWKSIPFILLRDIVWMGMLIISSPKIIIRLLGIKGYLKRAFKKRRIIKANE